MNTVTDYMSMSKAQLEKFAKLLKEEYKAEYELKYMDDDFIEGATKDDLAVELVVMETELYNAYFDKRADIKEARENLYNSKRWKK